MFVFAPSIGKIWEEVNIIKSGPAAIVKGPSFHLATLPRNWLRISIYFLK
jgi:hypothetical protein